VANNKAVCSTVDPGTAYTIANGNGNWVSVQTDIAPGTNCTQSPQESARLQITSNNFTVTAANLQTVLVKNSGCTGTQDVNINLRVWDAATDGSLVNSFTCPGTELTTP